MPIPEPSTEADLWPKVKAKSGWPDTDEDTVNSDLAGGWQAAAQSLATARADVAARAAEAHSLWQDDAGAEFEAKAAELTAWMDKLSPKMTDFANDATDLATKTAQAKYNIRGLIEANVGKYKLLDLAPGPFDSMGKATFESILAEKVKVLIAEAAGVEYDPSALTKLVDGAKDTIDSVVDGITEFGQDAWGVVQDNANVIANVSDVVGDVSTLVGAAGDLAVVGGAVIGGPFGAALGEIPNFALDTVSVGLGVTALAGHSTAKLAGADVPTETFIFDGLGIGTAYIPGSGLGMLGLQGVWEAADHADGGDQGDSGDITTIYDDFEEYWTPRDLRQTIQGAVVGPIPVAIENAVRRGIEEDDEQ